jgi:hypothetical protein
MNVSLLARPWPLFTRRWHVVCAGRERCGGSTDLPVDLDVRPVGGDREAAVPELGRDSHAAVPFHGPEGVLERGPERVSVGRQADGCVPATVGPDLAVVGHGARL